MSRYSINDYGFPNIPGLVHEQLFGEITALKTRLAAVESAFGLTQNLAQAAYDLALNGGTPPTLGPLTLTPDSFTEDAAFVSTIGGRAVGSMITAVSDDGTALTIDGNSLRGTFANPGTFNITLTEAYVGLTPYTTILPAVVSAAAPGTPTLGTLSLSTALTSGTSISGTILGATAGSSLALTPAVTGLSINSAARTFNFDGTGTAGTSVTITETLAGAIGSPKANAVGTIAAVGATLGALSLSGTLTNSTTSTGTITGATSGSTITSNVTGLSVNSGARTYSFDGSAIAGTTANGLVETLAGATNSPRSTPVTVAAAGAVAPTPPNYSMLSFSDSRGDAHAVNATQDGTGYKPTMYNRGVGGLIGAFSGHKVRLGRTANFSISGGSTAQAAIDPRQPQGGGTATPGTWYRGSAPTSGSDNKGFVPAGQAPEGLVFILLGTNGFVAGTGAGSSFADIQTIIAGILAQNANKVIILANELPKGRSNDNTLSANDLNTGGATFKAYSDNLKKLSFDSGDPLANPRVITVDTWASILDTTDNTIVARNLRGTLTDGLHPSAYGARLITQAVVNRLSAVWSNWASLPAQITVPTANGLTSIADAQPYLNSNPIMTAGTNGTVLSTWGTAPTAATVPQGWQISGTNVGSISVVCDKTTTPGEWKLTITGNLTVANSAPIILQNNVAAGTISNSALFSLTDKLRPMVAVAIDAGSVGLASVSARGTIFGDTGAKNRVGIAGAASAFGKINDFSDYGDGVVRRFLGEVLDLAEPNMQTTPGALTSVSSITPAVYIEFAGAIGDPVSAVIRVREAGIYRSAS